MYLGRYEEALEAYKHYYLFFYVNFISYDKAISIAPKDLCFTNKAILMEKLNRI